MQSCSGCAAVNVSHEGVHVGVFGVNTVIGSCNLSVANHEQHTVLFADTGGVAAHFSAVQGQVAVGVVRKNTNGRRQRITGQHGANVVVITVLNDDGVVAEVNRVGGRLNSHAITIGCCDTNGIWRGSSCRQADGVATDNWTVVVSCGGCFNDVDGCATVAERISHGQGVATSVGVAP